jgi:hypothetical protein
VETAVARHQASLLRYASRLLGDADLARDVVQDTFVKLMAQEPESVAGHEGGMAVHRLQASCTGHPAKGRAHEAFRERVKPSGCMRRICVRVRECKGRRPGRSCSR